MADGHDGPDRLNSLTVVRRRLFEQRLAGDRFERADDVIAWLGAMQAQELAEVKWSIAERTQSCTDADVDAALDRGDILRTHLLRPTWHVVTPADIRWLLRLTAPRVHQANRYMYVKLELDAELLARATDVFVTEIDATGPRTRVELAAALSGAGIEAAGLRLGYLLMHAELEAVLCSGPRRGRQQTYELLDERAPAGALDAIDRDAALTELAVRYFGGHGPATDRDLAYWASLTLADVRRGIASAGDRLERRVDADGTTWLSDPDSTRRSDATGAFLIPMYDETVTYRSPKVVIDGSPADGQLERPIVIDGRTVGSWRRTLTAREVTVNASLFRLLEPVENAALHAAVDRFGRFLGTAARLET